MRKVIYLFVVIIVFCAEKASAQKDTVWVCMKYAKNSNGERTEIAENRDSADFMRMITTPDSSVDKTLYPVNDFYLNGKLKLRSLSIVNMAAHTLFQGTCLEYYPNGLKKSISNFEKGNQEGDINKYYPNGKIYMSGSYYQHKFKLIECRDSTGKELAENGNGKWIKYSDDFKILYSEGPVEGGIQQYDWKG
ncbi:hypothetical protein [Mucilaginibacter sp. SP1R1]|uniref:hypothetical protein n=1 Tax=Mucilaginibacter sp. SP1R1 TaxID=2723091 RepID=UPI0016125982|nr:hypothetical protein [Mucilaginibacter sp. SP1R1]MBB6149804.1 antitoxin component YwqK of YwqJK toxin-antitoxin module [Mucilaginibacter sp. SP1R1]